MLFHGDLIDKILGWFIVLAFISFVIFMLFFNDGTRGVFALLVFYYLFGLALHLGGKSNRYTLIYDVVEIAFELLWKRQR